VPTRVSSVKLSGRCEDAILDHPNQIGAAKQNAGRFALLCFEMLQVMAKMERDFINH